MNLSNRVRSLLPTAAAALPLILSVLSAQADARDRVGERDITHTGANGRETHRTTERARVGNAVSSNTTVTGTDGRSATRTSNGQYDPETKTWTRHSESTGPNGKTATTDATAVRTDNGYVRDVTHTNPSGETSTRHSEGTYDPATQTWSRSTVATGPDGKSATTSATTARTDSGYQRDLTRTGPNGQTTTAHTDAVIDREAGTAQRTTTVTRPNGATATKEVTRSWTPKSADESPASGE
ncbi:MAG: hypothetical protein ACJ8OJ_13025 [Povalibacter sp.]